MKRFFLLLILIFALALLPACGRKGDLIVPGTVLPEAPAGFTAEPGENVVLLAWTMPEKNTAGRPLTDLTGFIVQRAEMPEGQEECPCKFEKAGYVDLEFPGDAAVEGGRVAWPDRWPGLAVGKRYGYKVVGVNRDGFAGVESGLVIVRLLTPPEPPSELVARPANKTVILSWKPPSKDKAGNTLTGLAGFNLYRSGTPDGFPARPVNAQPIQGGPFEDKGLVNGVKYYYRLTALRGAEPPFTESGPAPAVSATPADTEPPAPPTGLRVVPGEGKVLLSWDPNVEGDLAGYKVYRQDPGGPGLKPVTEVLIGITYTDSGVSSGATYNYAVTAVDNAAPPNESGLSAIVTVNVP